MKKTFISALIISFLILAGCKNVTELSPDPDINIPLIDPDIEQSLKAETKINFDILSLPTSPTLVLPSYLAINRVDGTLITEYRTLDPLDKSDPLVAMSTVDGWSTSQGFEINFNGNPLAKIGAGQSFYFLQSGDPRDKSDTTTAIKREEGTDYRISVLDKTIKITLLKPLLPGSHYMFAVTNELLDIKGKPVGMTPSYAALKTNMPLPSTSLEDARAITHTTENTFEKSGVNKSTIIFSSWFTTASVGDVLFGAKSVTALALKNGAQNVWTGSAIAEGITPESLKTLFTMSAPILSGPTKGGNGEIYTGQITLPYYLDIQPDKFLTTPWKSGMPSTAKIRDLLANGSNEDKETMITQLIALGITPENMADIDNNRETKWQVIRALTGATLMLANGKQLDSERIPTRFSPIPMLKSVQTMEYTLVLPKAVKCQDPASNAVTIYQHGVTSDKSSLTTSFLADGIISNKCRAIIAINHPLHGDRGITGQNASSDPLMYLNMTSLEVARDNLRQSTIDVINLRAAIGKVLNRIATLPDDITALGKLGLLDPAAGVSFIGHSLGAIVGINAANISNRSLGDLAVEKLYFTMNKVALANPGASIPYLLMNSQSFSSLMKGTIAAKINKEYVAFCEGKSPLFCYGLYEKNLLNEGSPSSLATLTTMYDSFSQFSYTAQTIFDSVDPINHAPSVPASMPIYLSQVKNDSVIPNFIPENKTVVGTDIPVPYSPLAGTMPLLKVLALSPVRASITGQKIKNAALFNKGSHISLLSKIPNAKVPAEMYLQIQSFINGDGNTLTVNDTSLLDGE